jgi:hypothetical protein
MPLSEVPIQTSTAKKIFYFIIKKIVTVTTKIAGGSYM